MMEFLLWPIAIICAIILLCALVASCFWYIDLRFSALLKEIDPKDLP